MIDEDKQLVVCDYKPTILVDLGEGEYFKVVESVFMAADGIRTCVSSLGYITTFVETLEVKPLKYKWVEV